MAGLTLLTRPGCRAAQPFGIRAINVHAENDSLVTRRTKPAFLVHWRIRGSAGVDVIVWPEKDLPLDRKQQLARPISLGVSSLQDKAFWTITYLRQHAL